MSLSPRAVFSQPLTAQAHGGEVIVHGPGMRGASFTPEAALRSAESVRVAAEKALRAAARAAPPILKK